MAPRCGCTRQPSMVTNRSSGSGSSPTPIGSRTITGPSSVTIGTPVSDYGNAVRAAAQGNRGSVASGARAKVIFCWSQVARHIEQQIALGRLLRPATGCPVRGRLPRSLASAAIPSPRPIWCWRSGGAIRRVPHRGAFVSPAGPSENSIEWSNKISLGRHTCWISRCWRCWRKAGCRICATGCRPAHRR
jgi:hypothetical protein